MLTENKKTKKNVFNANVHSKTLYLLVSLKVSTRTKLSAISAGDMCHLQGTLCRKCG